MFQLILIQNFSMEKNCNNDRSNFVLAMAGNKCDIDETKKKISTKLANFKF